MEEESGRIPRGLGVESLSERLRACEVVCTSLAHEFDAEGLTHAEKATIARQWEVVLKESYLLSLLLDLLKRQDREMRGLPSFEPGAH